MGFDIVQMSDRATISPDEVWKDIRNIMDIQYRARLGSPRQLILTVLNPSDNSALRKFRAYQRIRVIEQGEYAPFFLGRIEKLNPKFSKGTLEIICRDYMGDLADRTNVNQMVTGKRRSDIVKEIIDNGVFIRKDGMDNNINYTRSVQTFQVEDSPFLGNIGRAYGNSVNGFESILESVRKLGMEESWQDLQAIMHRESADTYEFATPILWGGGEVLKKPRNDDILYLGSKEKFTELYFNNNKDYDGSGGEPTILFGYSESNFNFESLTLTEPATPSEVITSASGTFAFDEPSGWESVPQEDLDFSHTDLTGINEPDFEDVLNDLYWISISVSEDVDFGSIDAITIEQGDMTSDINTSGWDYRVEGQELLYYNDINEGDTTVTIKHPFPFSGIEVIDTDPEIDNITGELITNPDIPNVSFEGNNAPEDQTPSNPKFWSVQREDSGIFVSWNSSEAYTITISDLDFASRLRSGRYKLLTAPVASFKYFEKGTQPNDYHLRIDDENDLNYFTIPIGKLDIDNRDNLPSINWATRERTINNITTQILDDMRFDMQSYNLGENNADLVTRVTVIGRNSVRGYAEDTELENELGIIKEKISTNNWDLSTHADCEVRARAILKQYGSSYTYDDMGNRIDAEGFRTIKATLTDFPSYKTADGIRRYFREGDVALVSVRGDDDVTDVPHIIHEIAYGEQEGKTTVVLSRDNLMNNTTDNAVDAITDAIADVRANSNAAGWAGHVPSERSANQIIWHETIGEYEPYGRTKFNVVEFPELDVDGEEVIDSDGNVVIEDTQSTIDFDDFIGRPSTDIVPEENWQTNLRIKQDDGGAVLFRGLPDGEKVQEVLNDFVPRGEEGGDAVGGLFHNSTTGFVNASVPESVRNVGSDYESPLRQLQNSLAGEWGRINPDTIDLLILPELGSVTDGRRSVTYDGSNIITNLQSGQQPMQDGQMGEVFPPPVLNNPIGGIDNPHKDRAVLMFDKIYRGRGLTSNEPPMVLFTPDASQTNEQIFIPYIEHWIQLDITFPTDDAGETDDPEYYFLGCVVRFHTVITTTSISPTMGGLYNVQATANGELVIPQRITDGDSTVIHSIYRETGGELDSDGDPTRPPYASYVVFARY